MHKISRIALVVGILTLLSATGIASAQLFPGPVFATWGGGFSLASFSPAGTTIGSGWMGGLFNGTHGIPLSFGMGVTAGGPGTTPMSGIITTSFGSHIMEGITEVHPSLIGPPHIVTGIGSDIQFGSSTSVSGTIQNFGQSYTMILGSSGSPFSAFH
jgi:hypothetical protein